MHWWVFLGPLCKTVQKIELQKIEGLANIVIQQTVRPMIPPLKPISQLRFDYDTRYSYEVRNDDDEN